MPSNSKQNGKYLTFGFIEHDCYGREYRDYIHKHEIGNPDCTGGDCGNWKKYRISNVDYHFPQICKCGGLIHGNYWKCGGTFVEYLWCCDKCTNNSSGFFGSDWVQELS